ncbi:uncharacterized protein LAESUDRAFT_718647 [Laetiporus sulphureus 93-53]|uniref:C2H2-type domain-containing protein n=1 Tax=Laetiporus sulphureus 93-53 TaxID=1314785 RepID=A0A165AQX8_9APHY|nr:uncharacterized protein LAESUDRAFT_718647 [Laetiporus sulphureus 93-53]KZS99483.1 hypothetical protein LAESUDRAFT_718647 [Laetiporus sulphureus 93-53]
MLTCCFCNAELSSDDEIPQHMHSHCSPDSSPLTVTIFYEHLQLQDFGNKGWRCPQMSYNFMGFSLEMSKHLAEHYASPDCTMFPKKLSHSQSSQIKDIFTERGNTSTSLLTKEQKWAACDEVTNPAHTKKICSVQGQQLPMKPSSSGSGDRHSKGKDSIMARLRQSSNDSPTPHSGSSTMPFDFIGRQRFTNTQSMGAPHPPASLPSLHEWEKDKVGELTRYNSASLQLTLRCSAMQEKVTKTVQVTQHDLGVVWMTKPANHMKEVEFMVKEIEHVILVRKRTEYNDLYRATWRKKGSDRIALVCTMCGMPKSSWEVTNHYMKKSSQHDVCRDDKAQSWYMELGYIIFRVPHFKQEVFRALGLPITEFADITEWATYLKKTTTRVLNDYPTDQNCSNLIDAIFAFKTLFMDDNRIDHSMMKLSQAVEEYTRAFTLSLLIGHA